MTAAMFPCPLHCPKRSKFWYVLSASNLDSNETASSVGVVATTEIAKWAWQERQPSSQRKGWPLPVRTAMLLWMLGLALLVCYATLTLTQVYPKRAVLGCPYPVFILRGIYSTPCRPLSTRSALRTTRLRGPVLSLQRLLRWLWSQ